jgi:hypothetical protein
MKHYQKESKYHVVFLLSQKFLLVIESWKYYQSRRKPWQGSSTFIEILQLSLKCALFLLLCLWVASLYECAVVVGKVVIGCEADSAVPLRLCLW